MRKKNMKRNGSKDKEQAEDEDKLKVMHFETKEHNNFKEFFFVILKTHEILKIPIAIKVFKFKRKKPPKHDDELTKIKK